MGKALSYAIREKIIAFRKEGQSFVQISERLGCSVSGVKKIWYAYQKRGISALKANYSNCGRPSPYEHIRSQVDEIRDNHQGSTYVYSKLVQHYGGKPVPKARTLCHWWKKTATNRPRGRPRSIEKKRGQNKHTTLGR